MDSTSQWPIAAASAGATSRAIVVARQAAYVMAMLSYFANPERFWRLSGPLGVTAAAIAAIALPAGWGLGLLASPAERDQGELARIMFVHVPAASLAMMAYAFMAVASLAYYVWRHPVADEAAKAAAPLGAGLAAITLATGMIWAHPTWGAWWVWDARLTSMLVLFLTFLGYLALRAALEDERQAAVAAAILCLVGAVNLPIVKFSVDWWWSLHQPASNRLSGTAMDAAFFWPLVLSAIGYKAGFVGLVLLRVRTAILRRRNRRGAPVRAVVLAEEGA